MSFKEFLKKDIDNVFLNCNEFAEEMDINGIKRKAILDYRDNISSSLQGDGVLSSDEAFLYVAEDEEFQKARYRKGKSIEIDDESFLIVSVGKHQGMLSFKLSRNEGY